MNYRNVPKETFKPKNWQWRIILTLSCLLLFGDYFFRYLYVSLGIENGYRKVSAVSTQLTPLFTTTAPPSPTLIIDVKNDTPNLYVIDTNTATGLIQFASKNFFPAETKRFTVKPVDTSHPTGTGQIVFTSALLPESTQKTCQEVHALTYDLKYAEQMKGPITLRLSEITSQMDCKSGQSQIVSGSGVGFQDLKGTGSN